MGHCIRCTTWSSRAALPYLWEVTASHPLYGCCFISFSALSHMSSKPPSHCVSFVEVIRGMISHKSCRLPIRWDSDTSANVLPERRKQSPYPVKVHTMIPIAEPLVNGRQNRGLFSCADWIRDTQCPPPGIVCCTAKASVDSCCTP